jgi:hypothetical protein
LYQLRNEAIGVVVTDIGKVPQHGDVLDLARTNRVRVA